MTYERNFTLCNMSSYQSFLPSCFNTTVTGDIRVTNLVAIVTDIACHVYFNINSKISVLGGSEREKLVLDMYYNQGKNVREIAQKARMSFRDIDAILRKAAAVNGGGSNGNGNEIIIDNQQSSGHPTRGDKAP
jgi:hypothetical protein